MFWFAVSPGRIRSGSNVLDAKSLGSFGKYPCDVGGPVIRHHLTAIDTLTVELDLSPGHKADRRGLLFVSKNLDLSQPYGAVDGYMNPVQAHASRGALVPVAMVR